MKKQERIDQRIDGPLADDMDINPLARDVQAEVEPTEDKKRRKGSKNVNKLVGNRGASSVQVSPDEAQEIQVSAGEESDLRGEPDEPVVIPVKYQDKKVLELTVYPDALADSIYHSIKAKYSSQAAVINQNRKLIRPLALRRSFPENPELVNQIKEGVPTDPGDLPDKWSDGAPPIIIELFKQTLPHVLTVLREQAYYSMQFDVDFPTIAQNRDQLLQLAKREPRLLLNSFGLIRLDGLSNSDVIEILEELLESLRIRGGGRLRGERKDEARSPETRTKIALAQDEVLPIVRTEKRFV